MIKELTKFLGLGVLLSIFAIRLNTLLRNRRLLGTRETPFSYLRDQKEELS